MKAVFAGCARDCAEALPRVLEKIEAMAAHFEAAAYVVVENGSSDGTRKLLERFGAGRPRFSLLDAALLDDLPRRGQRLEMARNAIVEALRASSVLRGYDLMIAIDMDDANAQPQPLEGFSRSLDYLRAEAQCAAVFANQRGLYCDMWALRHPKLCPGDVWEEVSEYARARGLSDEDAFAATFDKRLFWIPVEDPPLEVDSAFGGLGIYKMPFVIGNPNPYVGTRVKVDGGRLVRWEHCEHVHFHAGIRAQGGRLRILPWLINGANEGITFNPSAFRRLVY